MRHAHCALIIVLPGCPVKVRYSRLWVLDGFRPPVNMIRLSFEGAVRCAALNEDTVPAPGPGAQRRLGRATA